MKKTIIINLLLVSLLLAGFQSSAQWVIEANPPKKNEASTFSFTNGQQQLGGVDWTAPGGTVADETSDGSIYSASITYPSIGTYTVTLKNAISHIILGEITVTVIDQCAQGLSAYLEANRSQFYGPASGTVTLKEYNGTITKWQRRTNGGSWHNIVSTSPDLVFTNLTDTLTEYRAFVSEGTCAPIPSPIQEIRVKPQGFAGYITGDVSNFTSESTINLTLNDHDGQIDWYWSSAEDSTS